MRKHIVIIFFVLFCICSFLGGVHFNDFITEWNILILTFGLLGFYLCLLENRITKELFLMLSLIILVPLIFFSGLSLIDSTLVSSINDWIGFLGAYLGVIGAICGIWWQLNEEKRKVQLGSLKIIEYYFQIILSKLKLTANSNNETKFYRDLFSRGLLIDSELVGDNKDYFIISKKDLEILNTNIINISSLDNYIDIFKIINALERIEEISSNCLSQNNFSKITEEIATNLRLNNSEIILILKTKLKLNYIKTHSSNPDIFENKLSAKEVEEVFKNIENISNIEELFSVLNDIRTIMHISLNLGTTKFYNELYKISHLLLDIGYVLWGNKDNPEIYTFETLETEIDRNLKLLKKEIKKLS